MLKPICSPILGGPMVKATFKNGLYENKLSKEAFEGYADPLQTGSHTALYYFFTSFKEINEKLPSYQQAIKSLNVPIQVIWGKEDEILIGEKQIPLIQSNFNVDDRNVHLVRESKSLFAGGSF